jgi:long-subunit acyl-CoA synthetase (AMP-forming)
VFGGYYKNDIATKEAFDDDGWFKTGDIGVMSRDGFLTITDRKKDLIITAGGKNIAPQPLENELKRSPLVSQAVVIGDRRPYLTALIGLDPETRAQSDDQAIKQQLDAHLARLNAALPSFEQIKKYEILPHEMTIESGELTPTLKVKRRVVNERYASEIENMYRS